MVNGLPMDKHSFIFTPLELREGCGVLKALLGLGTQDAIALSILQITDTLKCINIFH